MPEAALQPFVTYQRRTDVAETAVTTGFEPIWTWQTGPNAELEAAPTTSSVVTPGPGRFGEQNKLGSYYCWNRTYDLFMGRWTTPDPAATPWTNLFCFCRSKPIQLADPSGLQDFPAPVIPPDDPPAPPVFPSESDGSKPAQPAEVRPRGQHDHGQWSDSIDFGDTVRIGGTQRYVPLSLLKYDPDRLVFLDANAEMQRLTGPIRSKGDTYMEGACTVTVTQQPSVFSSVRWHVTEDAIWERRTRLIGANVPGDLQGEVRRSIANLANSLTTLRELGKSDLTLQLSKVEYFMVEKATSVRLHRSAGEIEVVYKEELRCPCPEGIQVTERERRTRKRVPASTISLGLYYFTNYEATYSGTYKYYKPTESRTKE